MLVGFFLVAMNFGHAAAVVQFCPEARTWGESMKIIFKRTMLFPLFLLILGIWLAVTLTFEPVTSSNDVRERGIRVACLSHMVHCAYCCSSGSRRLVSFLTASFISATCPDFLHEKLSAIDVVQLALFSHSGTGRFLSLISDDSILLRARFDSQFCS